MKIFLIVFIVSISSLYGQKVSKILLLGNSLTYFNNMPEKLKELCYINNFNVDIKTNANPGQFLKLNYKYYDSKNIHNSSFFDTLVNYDFVILQEAALRLGTTRLKKETFELLKVASTMCKTSSTKLIFFEPYNVLKNFPFTSRPNLNDLHEKDFYINSAEEEYDLYKSFSDSLAFNNICVVSKVGLCFNQFKKIFPHLILKDNEGHPTEIGSEIIAFIHFKKISSIHYPKFNDFQMRAAIYFEYLNDFLNNNT